jgi:hypothetical protein
MDGLLYIVICEIDCLIYIRRRAVDMLLVIFVVANFISRREVWRQGGSSRASLAHGRRCPERRVDRRRGVRWVIHGWRWGRRLFVIVQSVQNYVTVRLKHLHKVHCFDGDVSRIVKVGEGGEICVVRRHFQCRGRGIGSLHILGVPVELLRWKEAKKFPFAWNFRKDR